MSPADISGETCNLHLRGEISAIEAYTRAMEAFSESASIRIMAKIRSAHHRNADALRKGVISAGARPALRPGLWLVLLRRFESSVSWLGETATLRLMQWSEELQWKAYHHTLRADNVPTVTKLLIQDEIIPTITDNIIALHQHRDRTHVREQRHLRWRSPANDDSDSE